jgi:hypothetical protein
MDFLFSIGLQSFVSPITSSRKCVEGDVLAIENRPVGPQVFYLFHLRTFDQWTDISMLHKPIEAKLIKKRHLDPRTANSTCTLSVQDGANIGHETPVSK